ncbi:hypothetical protein T06_10877 [Trichinella sp. T6]|nr:hypothetical protein T06_10877 [Trichinella sp. T6]
MLKSSIFCLVVAAVPLVALACPLPCREPLASLGSSREFHLTACQCRFAYSMRSSTLSNRLPKT